MHNLLSLQVFECAAVVRANRPIRTLLDWCESQAALAEKFASAGLTPKILRGKRNYEGLWLARAVSGLNNPKPRAR